MDQRSLLRRHSVRPRKGMGQHFLVSRDILEAIAAAASLQPDDLVVEVGPGMGALTQVIAGQAGQILAVELDQELVPKLQEILAPHQNVRIVQGDILQLDLERELAAMPGPAAPAGSPSSVVSATPAPRYKVVANLPYYITTPILRYFFAQRFRPSIIVVTVQEEVGRRMTADPPEMNFLAVLVQFHGQPRIVQRIAPGAFYPPPKVGSAVVHIAMRETLPLDERQAQRFLRLVSGGFSQPRKQVHNPLAQTCGLSRAEIVGILRENGIDEKRRAETLSLEEWLRLSRRLLAEQP